MDISDRLQHLRKMKGISQETLADQLDVSRQAVSKWESAQSVPDLDKVVRMSEYFGVTTDYILKGIEQPAGQAEKKTGTGELVVVATALNFIGLIVSAAVWYEKQAPMAVVIGLIFMALGCMVFGVGLANASKDGRRNAGRTFWPINIWFLSFLPLPIVYNLLFARMAAPYPLLVSPILAFPIFWMVYIAIGLTVDLAIVRAKRRGGA